MSTTEPQNPILIAYAATAGGREPVEFGLAASHITGAPAVILNIRHGGPAVDRMTGTPDDSMGGDDQALQHLRLDLQRRGLTADVQVREARTTGGGLVAAMEELKPRMVVLGATSRSSLGAALLGTTIERVIHEAACPVAVVGPDYRRPAGGVQLIGAAYSPTEEGMDALHAAAALARAGGVRLRAITVLDPKHAAESSPGLMAEQHRDDSPDAEASEQHRLRHESEARDVLGRVAGDLDPDVDVLFNDPAEGLIAATRHIDLLIMGSRARGPRRAVVLGSVSRKVAERSACPVVIIPRGTGEAAEELVSHVGARGTS